jgi:hypothetical protein
MCCVSYCKLRVRKSAYWNPQGTLILTYNLGGGIMAGHSESARNTGKFIVVGGVLVQIFFFGVFTVVALVFDRRIRSHPTAKSRSSTIPWQKHMFTLYAASFLIMVRSIFRVIEFVQGNNGYIMNHEWFLYIFDALMMFSVLVNFNFVHPSEIKALLKGGRWSSGFRLHNMKSSRLSTASGQPLGDAQSGY